MQCLSSTEHLVMLKVFSVPLFYSCMHSSSKSVFNSYSMGSFLCLKKLLCFPPTYSEFTLKVNRFCLNTKKKSAYFHCVHSLPFPLPKTMTQRSLWNVFYSWEPLCSWKALVSECHCTLYIVFFFQYALGTFVHSSMADSE